MVVGIIVALELVRPRGDIFVAGASFFCRVRGLWGRGGGFSALDPVRGGIESNGGHRIEQRGVSGGKEVGPRTNEGRNGNIERSCSTANKGGGTEWDPCVMGTNVRDRH